jgi:hypothetical protein
VAEHIVKSGDSGPDELGAAEKRAHARHFPRQMGHDRHEEPRTPHPNGKLLRHPGNERLGHMRVRID